MDGWEKNGFPCITNLIETCRENQELECRVNNGKMKRIEKKITRKGGIADWDERMSEERDK